MDEGYTTEIIYMFRLRKISTLGILLPPSGENHSVRITYSGKKDFLTGGYFIDTEDEHIYYNSSESFAEDFFSCRMPLPENYNHDEGEILEVKAVMDIIKRPAPLTMLDPFYRSEIIKTSWVRLGS